MPWWVSLYGVCISLLSVGAVMMMATSIRRMRREVERIHGLAFHIGLAASEMWDTLTPEQIRQLHPYTVEVGNGLPPWREVSEAMKSTQESEST